MGLHGGSSNLYIPSQDLVLTGSRLMSSNDEDDNDAVLARMIRMTTKHTLALADPLTEPADQISMLMHKAKQHSHI